MLPSVTGIPQRVVLLRHFKANVRMMARSTDQALAAQRKANEAKDSRFPDRSMTSHRDDPQHRQDGTVTINPQRAVRTPRLLAEAYNSAPKLT